MKINDKFYKKYGSNAVILPPPLEGEEEETTIPTEENKVPENLQKLLLLVQDEGKTFEELQEGNLAEKSPGGLSGDEVGTIRPGAKRAQVMLPPAMPRGVKMPIFEMDKVPDTEAIEREHLKKIEEIEKAKEGGAEAEEIKQHHIDEMLRALEEGNFFNVASRKADKLLKLCARYFALCSK